MECTLSEIERKALLSEYLEADRSGQMFVLDSNSVFLKTSNMILHWRGIQEAIMQRDDFTCQLCGSKEDLVIDHLKPKRLGGEPRPENLRTLCQSCHVKYGFKWYDY